MVSSRYVTRVAARAGVAQDFLARYAQNEAELVVVGMAAFAEDSVRDREKQQLGGPVSQYRNT